MAENTPRFPWKLAAALVLGFPTLMLGWLIFPGVRPQDALARRWQAELSVLPTNELPPRMAQLAALQDAGLPVLVSSLYSEREDEAEAAYSALEIELVRWHAINKKEASRRAGLLARELARFAGQGRDTERRAAAELAAKLLAWKREGTALGDQIAADCESVLRAAVPPARRETLSSVSQATFAGEPVNEEPILEPLPDHELSSPVVPADVRVAANFPRQPTDSIEVDSASPALVSETPSAGVRSPRPFESPRARPLSKEMPVSQLDDLGLMRQLHALDGGVQAAAEHELMRRGYTAYRLRVARRLTDPDPAVRRELAEMLPQMSGLDARPWLFWLSEDADPSVRRAAAAILATSTDPQLRARLREMRSAEPLD